MDPCIHFGMGTIVPFVVLRHGARLALALTGRRGLVNSPGFNTTCSFPPESTT
jgi:hypothetical protein